MIRLNMEAKMRTKQISFNDQELTYLRDKTGLSSDEVYVLGYLKGFDREKLKKWNEKGLLDFSVDNI